MNWRAEHFMEHPEGGRFREVYRSPREVRATGGPGRQACTHIYFQLRKGEVSRFHRVDQEEVWNLYRGALVLWIYDEAADRLSEHLLSPETHTYCAVVPSGRWQAAEPAAEEALAGCTVAPGFEFEDFELITESHAAHRALAGKGLERML